MAVKKRTKNVDEALTKTEHAAEQGDFNRVLEEYKNTRRRPNKSLSEFQRDLLQLNTLIEGGFGKRGNISMHVSTTGTGKSVVQTQSAICFAQGVPCCGLTPKRPFKSWIIQSEDDEDRVAFDRDGIKAHLSEAFPEKDWDKAIDETRFLDFTGITGAKFVTYLDYELRLAEKENAKPDCVMINPMNAFFGGELKSGADCSAFFKGGDIRNHETEGLEAVAKRHGVWVWIYAHTPKPPTSRKEYEAWLNAPNPEYKVCGASEIVDAVRSIIAFFRVPDLKDDVFTFLGAKNGRGLGWTDADGNRTTKQYFRWAKDENHYWEAVPKDEYPLIEGDNHKAALPTRDLMDEIPLALNVFKNLSLGGVVDLQTAVLEIRTAVNRDRRQSDPPVKDLSSSACRNLIEAMVRRGLIKTAPKGTKGTKGIMCGLPDVVDAWMKQD